MTQCPCAINTVLIRFAFTVGCLGGVGVGPIEVGLGKILHVQKIVDSYQFPFDEMIKVVSAVSSLLLRPPAPVSFSGQVKPASQGDHPVQVCNQTRY
ncbi:hypothetical protein Tco_1433215 [Tanacetum coccineum]